MEPIAWIWVPPFVEKRSPYILTGIMAGVSVLTVGLPSTLFAGKTLFRLLFRSVHALYDSPEVYAYDGVEGMGTVYEMRGGGLAKAIRLACGAEN